MCEEEGEIAEMSADSMEAAFDQSEQVQSERAIERAIERERESRGEGGKKSGKEGQKDSEKRKICRKRTRGWGRRKGWE